MTLIERVASIIEREGVLSKEKAALVLEEIKDATLTKCVRDSHAMDFYQPGLMGVWQKTIEDALDAG